MGFTPCDIEKLVSWDSTRTCLYSSNRSTTCKGPILNFYLDRDICVCKDRLKSACLGLN